MGKSLVTFAGALLLTCCATGASHGDSRTGIRLDARVDRVGQLVREPMIVQHPDGALFVAGYGGGTSSLWISRDGGATWERVNVGTEADGAAGNSDVDLAVARDGTLYFVAMTFDRKANEGRAISIGVSRDVGATWSWTRLSGARFDDRPWVEVGPDGTAHVIWNDGQGVRYVVGTDRGTIWTDRGRIHPQGGSSHLAAGPNGELAVRVIPLSASGNKYDPGVDLIAVSGDGGQTWQKVPAPGKREWIFPLTDELSGAQVPRWVEPLAWDAAGALYTLWSTREALWLARSVDRGQHWTEWLLASGGDIRYYPYLVAAGPGELAASWFSGFGERTRAHVARMHVSGETVPRLVESEPLRLAIFQRDAPSEPDTGGEYLALSFLRDGALALVAPLQDPARDRFGFSFWKIEPVRPGTADGGRSP